MKEVSVLAPYGWEETDSTVVGGKKRDEGAQKRPLRPEATGDTLIAELCCRALLLHNTTVTVA